MTTRSESTETEEVGTSSSGDITSGARHRFLVYLSDISPTCKDDIVSNYDDKRYFFTPKKMGAQTAEANINAGVAAANQIVRFFETGDVTLKVN
jgi:D-3-phosphoglycerate dehydrogenase